MQSKMQPLSVVTHDDAYAEASPNSRGPLARARKILPDGVTRDNRRIQPSPSDTERAAGAYRRDVDGHHDNDHRMGHGALLLGHSPPHICCERRFEIIPCLMDAYGVQCGLNEGLDRNSAP